MRTTAILGIILMGLGIVSLAYFVSPMRLMFQSPMGLPYGQPGPAHYRSASAHMRDRSFVWGTAEDK